MTATIAWEAAGAEATVCPRCDGFGDAEMGTARCRNCNGTGRVPMEKVIAVQMAQDLDLSPL